jgi:hypothetical protein
MPIGFPEQLLPGILIYEAPARPGAVEQEARYAAPPSFRPLDTLTGEPIGGLDRDLSKHRRRDQLVDDAKAIGFAGTFGLAAQNDVERGAEPDETGKSLAATGRGDQAELDLGQAELGLGVIGGHAVVARERQFETGAEAGSVNGGDDRLVERFHSVDQLLSLEAESFRFTLSGDGGELLDRMSNASNSTRTVALSLLICSPGRSKATIATPFSTTVVNADIQFRSSTIA